MMERTASIKRDTKETRIALNLSLDGTGSADIFRPYAGRLCTARIF